MIMILGAMLGLAAMDESSDLECDRQRLARLPGGDRRLAFVMNRFQESRQLRFERFFLGDFQRVVADSLPLVPIDVDRLGKEIHRDVGGRLYAVHPGLEDPEFPHRLERDPAGGEVGHGPIFKCDPGVGDVFMRGEILHPDGFNLSDRAFLESQQYVDVFDL